jgi:hypothetical protein
VHRALGIVLLLLVAAGIATGCGSSQRVEYERDLAKVGRGIDHSLAKLPTDDSQSISPQQVAGLADDLREAANQLDDLDPPDDAKDAQAKLARGLRGVARAFDDLASRLRKADTDSAKAELFVKFATDQQVDAAFDDIVAAQKQYSSKGYRVFSAPASVTATPRATKTTTAHG